MDIDINAKRSREDYLLLIPKLKTWLGEAGLLFFRNVKAEHGKVNAVWIDGGIPHVIHWREGIQIRNKLRDLTNNAWSVYEYDNTWTDIIEECIC
jgi:hypothetical protein